MVKWNNTTTKNRMAILVSSSIMDDLLIFCKNRHRLRQAIKALYRLLQPLGLTLSKAKTITIAKPSLQRFYNRLHQLYEQRASLVRVKTCLDNCLRWVRGGLSQWRIILPDSVHYLINNPGNLTAYLIEHRALLGG